MRLPVLVALHVCLASTVARVVVAGAAPIAHHPAESDEPAPQPMVTLTAHRASLKVVRRAAATLVVGVTARNGLAVDVEALEVGVVFARDPSLLRGADPAALYAQGSHVEDDGLGVVVEAVELALPAGAERGTEFTTELAADAPEPVVFATHLLGYRLADATAPLLLRLLGTRAPADEAAAVGAFGLLGGEAARAAARERWRGHDTLVQGLVDYLLLPLSEKPTQDDAFARIYAALALGTLGGPDATDALYGLLFEPDWSALDGPLQVLRVSRVVGSPLETPLGFALSADVRTAEDLVRLALARARAIVEPLPLAAGGDDPGAIAAELPGGGEEAPQGLDAYGMPTPPVVEAANSTWASRCLWALAGGVLLALALLARRGRRSAGRA